MCTWLLNCPPAPAAQPCVPWLDSASLRTKPLVGPSESVLGSLPLTFPLLNPPELPPLQGPDLCARPELTTWASLPSGFMSLLGHGAACHLVLTLDSTLPLPACIGLCFSSCPHRKARPSAEGQPAMQTCKLVQGRAPRTGREHCSPTYRPVQHRGDEVIANPFHLISRQLRPVQLLRLSKDGAFGIHPNDLQRGDR